MMSWRVLSSVICPNTGIVYSHIVGLKLLRLIIWYESDIYLCPETEYIQQKWNFCKWRVQPHIPL